MAIREILEALILREGGYVDNVDDLGGATNFGITLAEYKRRHPHGTKGDLRKMPKSEAYDIYLNEYYIGPGFDRVAKISPLIAEELVDTGVNMGIGIASMFFQRCLNAFNGKEAYYADIVVDGDVGKASIDALIAFLQKRGKHGERVFLKALDCLQGARYIELAEKREANESFVFGWIDNRIQL